MQSKSLNLTLAISAAKLAKKALHQASNSRVIEKSLDHDYKISGDKIADDIIATTLREKSEYPVYSEEKEFDPEFKKGFYWIIDPLDGTVNFQREIPIACTSIALWQDNTPILGVVLDLFRDECFYGEVGQGAFVNEKPIHVSNISEKKEAIACTGISIVRDYSSTSLSDLISKIQNFKKVRIFGSAALSLAYIAAGKIDYYEEDEIAIWDTAAGIAILLAAGGKANWTTSEKYPLRHHVIASNGMHLKEGF